MSNTPGEITMQRLLEDFELAEENGKLSHIETYNTTITWKGRQYQTLVKRKSPGYNNFEIHLTKIRIAWLSKTRIPKRKGDIDSG